MNYKKAFIMEFEQLLELSGYTTAEAMYAIMRQLKIEKKHLLDSSDFAMYTGCTLATQELKLK